MLRGDDSEDRQPPDARIAFTEYHEASVYKGLLDDLQVVDDQFGKLLNSSALNLSPSVRARRGERFWSTRISGVVRKGQLPFTDRHSRIAQRLGNVVRLQVREVLQDLLD
jgi:hypothetical protein